MTKDFVSSAEHQAARECNEYVNAAVSFRVLGSPEDTSTTAPRSVA